MLQKNVDFINLPSIVTSPGRWKANPNDPFIYISFSKRQLTSVNRHDNTNHLPLSIFSLLELNEETVTLFKTIIENEWINKAKFPLKFLPPELSGDEIVKKNVCFIVHSEEEETLRLEVTTKEAMTMAYNAYPYPSDTENKFTEASYKVIWLPHIAPGKIPTQTIFRFLHQTGHALAEFKNTVDMAKGLNYPPYNPHLTCWDTVMVPIQHHYCPLDQTNFQYPTQLGIIDLAGVAKFIQEWEKRNRIDPPPDPNAIYIRMSNTDVNNKLTARWRANPEDPFIYVSFSMKQLIASRSYDTTNQLASILMDAKKLDDDTITLFKTIIQMEWVDKAKFPLKFLSTELTGEEISKKNVCFIINSIFTTKADTRYLGLTQSCESNIQKPNQPIEISYKVIWFPRIDPGQISNEASNLTIFTMLHETGHAFAEFKHAIQTPTEFANPPYYSKLTCLDTVMITTPQYCPAYDGSSPYPSQLGPIDIAGASEFVKEWRNRNNLPLPSNNAPQQPIALTQHVEFFNNQKMPVEQKSLSHHDKHDNYFSQLTKCLWQFKRSLLNLTNSAFDFTIQKAQDYAQEVVSQCPSYFVQNDFSRQPKRNHLTFFATHSETSISHCESHYLTYYSNGSITPQ